MSTYLITGGLGFIGWHLTRRLIHEGSHVVSYDAQKHYVPLSKSHWPEYLGYRLDHPDLDYRQLTLVRGDTNDRGLLKEVLEHETRLSVGPFYIIHLASLPIASVANRHPEEARRNILNGTIVLLDAIRESGVGLDRLVYVSSSMVYGDFQRDANGEIIPATEDQPCSPIGLYGAMKLAGEHIVRAYGCRFGIPYTIVRPSAVYGATDCNRRVTEIFVERALAGEPLRLDNGGHHKLDFTHVSDLVDGLVLAATHPGARNETFNVTRGKGRSIRELAEIVALCVPGTELYEEEQDVYRPNRGALDISKAQRVLGYKPRVSLEQGIPRYLESVRRMQ